jgi:DNA-binding HxlR family transcriptional regulator
MTAGSYHQFCPVALAAEILGTRWTLVLLRELVVGSKRFNELRRGLPRMSPALLSKRLRELEAAGVIERHAIAGEPGAFEYHLSESGRELRPVIEAVGVWGQRWVTSAASLANLDVDLLMWDIKRNIVRSALPPGRHTIQFIYTDLPPTQRNWWLTTADTADDIDLCFIDPGFDVDLYLTTDLRTMTEIWLGLTPLRRACDDGRLLLTGDRRLESGIGGWLRLGAFAKVAKVVA